MSLRLVVMASGEGSNLQAIIDAIESGLLKGASIEALICDTPGAYCIERAIQHGILVHLLPLSLHARRGTLAREIYDKRLAAIVAHYEPDYILLLGWMRLLGQAFLANFPGKVINLHPALPGIFPGTHAIERTFAAFQQDKITTAGIMLHLVPDEGIDVGPVLRMASVPVLKEDTLQTFEARIHEIEHREVVALIQDLLAKDLHNAIY